MARRLYAFKKSIAKWHVVCDDERLRLSYYRCI